MIRFQYEADNERIDDFYTPDIVTTVTFDDYTTTVELLTELKGFPLMKRDDIVDACSYAYNYLSEQGGVDMISAGGKRKRRRRR